MQIEYRVAKYRLVCMLEETRYLLETDGLNPLIVRKINHELGVILTRQTRWLRQEQARANIHRRCMTQGWATIC